MKNTTLSLLTKIALISLVTFVSQNALAADTTNGKTLHDQSCIACHSSLTSGKPDSLYTRTNRKFNTLDGLNKQVMRCQSSVGANWFDDQIEDVVQYLNTTFYKVK